jgi:hypothetical protein
MGGGAAVVVGPQRDDDDRPAARIGRVDQRIDEGRALVVRAACREDLLELIDGDQEAPAGRQRVERGGDRVDRSRLQRSPERLHRLLAGRSST